MNYRNKMMTSKNNSDDIITHLLDLIAQTKWNNLKVAVRASEFVTKKLKEDHEEKDS